ncbi:MAG: acyl-CoA dehydrogenase family protein [Acidimicrobiia bacterium]
MWQLESSHRALLEQAEAAGHDLADMAETGRSLLAALAAQGLLGRIFPETREVSALDLCLIRQGLARSCLPAGELLAVHALGSYPIRQSGSKQQQERWMPDLVAGRTVAAFALTEPGAGSDAGNLALAAERDGAGFRLTGEKTYISNAPDADIYTVFARTTPETGAKGVTAFVVPAGSPGLSGEPIELLSPHPIGRLRFDGVPVASDQMLGHRDEGFRVAMRTLDLFRPSVGAFAVGMGEAALRLAVTHAQERIAFGQPIAAYQAVSHPLADMALALEASRLLVYSAAAAHDRGDTDLLTGLAAAAKLFATEAAQRVVDSAIQILGARGLEANHPLAHLYKEVRAPRIYEGTSEIQRNIIARELLRGRWPL